MFFIGHSVESPLLNTALATTATAEGSLKIIL